MKWLGFNAESVTILTVLMIIDIITGVMCAYILEGGRSITSRALSIGLLKKVMILLVLFAVALVGKGIGFDMAGLVQGCVSVFIISEAYSVIGNVQSARTGKKKVEFDAVSLTLAKIGDMLKKMLK